MPAGNIAKAKALGEPFGTANNRLRKMLLFDFAKRCNEDICYRCGIKIDKIEEFSIEHKISWFYSSNPKETFFDLSNIAFSHIRCNISHISISNHKRYDNKKQVSSEEAWCSIGQHTAHIDKFHKNGSRWNGLHDSCMECRAIYRAK